MVCRTDDLRVAAQGALVAVMLALAGAGCAGPSPDVASSAVVAPPANETTAPATAHPAPLTAADLKPATPVEEKYGIRYESLRLSGGGLLVDFRYRVLDIEKAAAIINRKVQPYIQDVETGHQFRVPHAQKVGTLRHMGGNLKVGRAYSVLFANPGRTMKSGSRASVVIGDYRLNDVIVE